MKAIKFNQNYESNAISICERDLLVTMPSFVKALKKVCLKIVYIKNQGQITDILISKTDLLDKFKGKEKLLKSIFKKEKLAKLY